jgi:hypothetical protein
VLDDSAESIGDDVPDLERHAECRPGPLEPGGVRFDPGRPYLYRGHDPRQHHEGRQ